MHERWRAALGANGDHACGECGARFLRHGHLVLHRGREHPRVIAGNERDAFQLMTAAEDAWMQALASHVKSGLVVLPVFLIWAATLVLLIEMRANVAWIVMTTPGYVFFGGLVYAMAYGYLTGGRESYHGRA